MTKGVFKVTRGYLPPLKGHDQLPQNIQSSEPTETEVGGKQESLQQQFASLYLPLSPSLP